jgi:hypothetical protein
MVQAQVGIHLFQALVLVFQLAQSPQGGGVHAPVVGLPLMECASAEAVLSAQLRHWHASLCLLQEANDLILTVA